MEWSRRKLVEGGGRRAGVHPGVGTELLLEPYQSFVVVIRLRFDPYY